MKTQSAPRARSSIAFTLIELLVVIAVIGLLAGLIFPAARAVKQKAVKTRAQAELRSVVIAIESYKDKLGHYPPDSPESPYYPRTNQLYFELMGTKLVNNGTEYETLDGSARIAVNALRTVFGPGVTGFINFTRTENADDAPPAKSFLDQLKPGQSGEIAPGIRILTCPVQWPVDLPRLISSNPNLNPWRYVSTNPANNSGGFDLWVDIVVGGKTNRVSNWSQQPQIVGDPS